MNTEYTAEHADPEDFPGPTQRPVAQADTPVAWLGLPIRLLPLIAAGSYSEGVVGESFVALARSGRGRRQICSGSTRLQLRTAPGLIDMMGAGFEWDRISFAGTPGEVVAVSLPEARLARWLPEDSRPFRLATRHEVVDDALGQLMQSMWQEASSGCAHGALYAEGLSMALVGLLTALHVSPAQRPREGATLSRVQRARVLDLIEADLSGDLRIERLAAAAGLSGFHFSRIFKRTFGQSPHAFVVGRRLEAACVALRTHPERSVADISSTCGFASQAHFTEVFRQRLGTTPARWRVSS